MRAAVNGPPPRWRRNRRTRGDEVGERLAGDDDRPSTRHRRHCDRLHTVRADSVLGECRSVTTSIRRRPASGSRPSTTSCATDGPRARRGADRRAAAPGAPPRRPARGRPQHAVHQHDPGASARSSTPATSSSSTASARSSAGTRSRSCCTPTRSRPSSAATSPATSRRRRSTRSASTTSGTRPSDDHGGDLVYIQGHSSPGIYARAFLEGRIDEDAAARLPRRRSAAAASRPTRIRG